MSISDPIVFDSINDPKVAELIVSGAVGVLPSDTVYGLMASAKLPGPVGRLYELKNREGKPGTIIAADIDQLVELGVKRRYLKAVEQFWPGPISVIIPCPELTALHLGLNSLPFRITDDDKLLNLLSIVGPLQTTSANPPGQEPATNITAAQEYFGDKVDFYVDGGDLSGREPSTIIRIDDDAITIIREGAAKIDEHGNMA